MGDDLRRPERREAGGSPSLGGYLATPAGTGPFPAVVMIHEAFGLNDMTRRHADRLASAGYLTLALDLLATAAPAAAWSARCGACPIVADFGGKDSTLKGAAQKLETALTSLGIEHRVKEFPTAGHAFLNDADLT